MDIALHKLDKNELISAFELCKTAIKLLHPILDSDEPCIAWEAYIVAETQITRLLDKVEKPNKLDKIIELLKEIKSKPLMVRGEVFEDEPENRGTWHYEGSIGGRYPPKGQSDDRKMPPGGYNGVGCYYVNPGCNCDWYRWNTPTGGWHCPYHGQCY